MDNELEKEQTPAAAGQENAEAGQNIPTEQEPSAAPEPSAVQPQPSEPEIKTEEPETEAVSATVQSEILGTQTEISRLQSTLPPTEPAEKKNSLWFFILLAAFCISAFCGVYLTMQPPSSCGAQPVAEEKASFSFSSKPKNGPAGIAWIKVRGVISEEDDSNNPFSRPSGASYISKRIREAAKSDRVKAIVLDINSPGGTVASVQDIYSEIVKAKEQGKKVVALFRDVAASGAFYIAMAADQIVAEPGTITGSVGVIMQAGNVSKLFDKIGIEVSPITSGKYKDIGSAYREMTPAERAILQDMVNDTYSQFFKVVQKGRPGVKPVDLDEYTDGRVFTGQRAFELGFIDKLGGEETARLLAGELVGISDPKIISQKSESLRDFFSALGSSADSKALTKQLQTLSTPSVAYLWVF